MRLVLDTSIAVKVFLPEEWSLEANVLLEGFRTGKHELIAPEILRTEFGNVMRREMGRDRLSEAQARGTWQRSLQIPIPTVPEKDLDRTAVELALKHRGGALDGLFVALALREGISFVTSDRPMINAYGSLGCLLHIKDLAP